MSTATHSKPNALHKGYSIGMELTGLLAGRFPELEAEDRDRLTEPVTLIVEFGNARAIDARQLARDLGGQGKFTAVVVRPRRGGGRLVKVLASSQLHKYVVECREATRMYRLEQSIRGVTK
ncbi:hypothetical protein ACFV98_11670 [Streptomyces violascens]|uniref:hypothetical protein n=1 Tax=Streptomyces violascens TaxID=67381 RepID=UPI0036612EFB